jgi:hypothetical protein
MVEIAGGSMRSRAKAATLFVCDGRRSCVRAGSARRRAVRFDLAHATQQAAALPQLPAGTPVSCGRSRPRVRSRCELLLRAPGTRLVDGTELLAHLIHPEHFEWRGSSDAFAKVAKSSRVSRRRRRGERREAEDLCILSSVRLLIRPKMRRQLRLISYSAARFTKRILDASSLAAEGQLFAAFTNLPSIVVRSFLNQRTSRTA